MLHNQLLGVPRLCVSGIYVNVWLAGGKDLNSDLKKLKKQYGQDYLLMEIKFPKDYPARPFALRVVSPRCMCVFVQLCRK